MVVKNSDQTAVGSIPRKRSLFNKPSWSRPQALSNDTNLFHRSSQTYADLAAEAELARTKKRLARKERGRACKDVYGQCTGKRRRTSEDEDEDEDLSSDESSNYSSRKEIKLNSLQSKNENSPLPTSPQQPGNSPKSLLQRYEAKITVSKVCQEQKEKLKASRIIDLEDEEDSSRLPGQELTWKSAIVKPAAPHDEDDQPVSDEEYPELARQARETARKKRLGEDKVATSAISHDGPLSLHQPISPDLQTDPILQILITSDIENTTPLIISRKLSQRLKDVRLMWAKRQNFTTEFTDTVFLTWRGKRVFDVTTCKSLGITVDTIGRISIKGRSWDEEEGQIHMEAMTPKILKAYKELKRNEATDQEDHTAQKQTTTTSGHEGQVRIVLKAKGLDDFKLQVRPVRHAFMECLLCWLTRISLPLYLGSSTLFVLGIRLEERKMSSYHSMESGYRLTAALRKQS